MSQAHVYLVDDDQGVNDALHKLFLSVNMPHQIFTSAEDFLKKYDGNGGCLVLDIRLRGMSGMMLQETLNRRNANLPIVFLTGHGNIHMAVDAMKKGAFDFLTKPFHNQELLDAVHRAMTLNENKQILENELRLLDEKISTLTPRERQLLDAIVEGKQTKEIASEMGISINTAQIHRANLMKKMQAKNLGSLINMVIKWQRSRH